MEPYIENDGFIGFWILGVPYYIEGDSYLNGSRKYLSNIGKILKKECTDTPRNYFGTLSALLSNKMVYMNGRRHYITGKGVKSSETIEVFIPATENMELCKELSFKEYTIDLSTLICAQFSTNSSDLKSILTASVGTCTSIGHKIAKSLIKIAALRIFADPEQSIIELPVNSMDSYFPELRIGKFGMGFFSFLWWLIDHPLRKLYIYSWFRENGKICSYRAIIKDEEGLTLNLKILPTSVIQTGTFIYLDASNDNFTASNIENFGIQISKLKHTSKVLLLKTQLSFPKIVDSHVFHTHGKGFLKNAASDDTPQKVFAACGATKIFVEDYASGISINTLVTSLFVPSVSTKTIKDTITTPIGWIPKHTKGDGFTILVSGVAVVDIKLTDYDSENKGIIIDMPPTTRIPVSRDDIILNENNTPLFISNVLYGLNILKSDRDLSYAQAAIQKYYDYTANSINKQAVLTALNTFTRENISLLVSKDLYNALKDKDDKLLISESMSVGDVEARLIGIFEGQTQNDVWYGKRVVTVSINYPQISTYGMSSLIFVSASYQRSQKSKWAINAAQGYPQLNLTPVGTDFGKDKNQKYISFVPQKLKDLGNREYTDLYLSVLAIYDGLTVYFTQGKNVSDLVAFSPLYQSILDNFELEGWRDISYTLLSKLSSFKGNQTYGGQQYEWVLTLGKARSYDHPSLKFKAYNTQGTIILINSIDEKALTDFHIRSGLIPEGLLFSFAVYGGRSIHDAILDISHSIVDYTICCITIMRIRLLYGSGWNFILPIVPDLMTKIQALRFTETDVKMIYSWWVSYSSSVSMTIPTYIQKLITDGSEWIALTKKPVQSFPYHPIVPSNTINFKTSKLISYLFTSEVSVSNVVKTFQSASLFKGESVKLQITEIAINEGTTKDFVSASLTELVQNSVDAIRSTGNPNKRIDIYYAGTEDDTFSICVEDFVGMNPEAFLYIGIPFLSTKTPSEMVTGEMGSGFFNVYRESSLVVIDTVYGNLNYVSYDTPIEENGRVVDIERKISILPSAKIRKNGTRIIIRSKPLNLSKRAEYLGIARYTCEKVLHQVRAFNNIRIFIDGGGQNMGVKLMFTIGYFEVYFNADRNSNLPSYVFTKGIPFAPLSTFYTKYHHRDVKLSIENDILVNVVHGGYTPVQTRTRINLPSGTQKHFDILLDYIVFVRAMETVVNDTNRYAWMYPNILSRGDANQLKPQKWSINDININKYECPPSAFLIFTNFDLIKTLNYSNQNTLTDYTNKLIDIMGDKEYKDTILKIGDFTDTIDASPQVKDLGALLLMRWASDKNTIKPNISVNKEKVEMVERDIKPDKPDKLMGPYIRVWLETFRDIAIKSKINGWSKNTLKEIKVMISEGNETAKGFYKSVDKLIFINTYGWNNSEREQIINNIKKAKTVFDLQNIKAERWVDYCGYRYPATTLPHELEHARRNQSHDSGHHDSIRTALWSGDMPQERTFDQAANAIFSKVISDGFYEELLTRYKNEI